MHIHTAETTLEESKIISLDNEVAIYNNLTASELKTMSINPRESNSEIEWCTAVIVLHGEICCNVGTRKLVVKPHNMLITIDCHPATFGAVSDDLLCRVMLFSRSFLSRLRLSDSFNAYFSIKQSPLVELDPRGTAAINSYLDMAFALLHYENPYRLESLVSLTEAFFYGAGYFFHLQQRQRDKNMSVILAEQFVNLVQQYGLQQHSLPFYADRLCVTTKYLSTCVRQTLGISALRVVQNHIAQEATFMLRESTLPFAQIAQALGFDSTEEFSKYYHRVTGSSPRSTRYIK